MPQLSGPLLSPTLGPDANESQTRSRIAENIAAITHRVSDRNRWEFLQQGAADFLNPNFGFL